mmetsp:Transcript_22395/g.61877  ORF Transcript_22395/g.61877 Transcript_22395/m.61877 type:complete len:214 (-) Transcript_22395:1253-1894(-)
MSTKLGPNSAAAPGSIRALPRWWWWGPAPGPPRGDTNSTAACRVGCTTHDSWSKMAFAGRPCSMSYTVMDLRPLQYSWSVRGCTSTKHKICESTWLLSKPVWTAKDSCSILRELSAAGLDPMCFVTWVHATQRRLWISTASAASNCSSGNACCSLDKAAACVTGSGGSQNLAHLGSSWLSEIASMYAFFSAAAASWPTGGWGGSRCPSVEKMK